MASYHMLIAAEMRHHILLQSVQMLAFTARYRSCAVRESNRDRRHEGYFQNTYQNYRSDAVYLKDPKTFFQDFRMTRDVFDILLENVERFHPGKKRKTIHHISIEMELVFTLRVLFNGTSFHSTAREFRIGSKTASDIIRRTCQAIYDALSPQYLAEPKQRDWRKIAENFGQVSNFERCVGAIDGCHIRVRCPVKSGTTNFNYKGYFSRVLMAVVDSNYCFTRVIIGAPGSASDGGIFKRSQFAEQLKSGKLDLPDAEPLPDDPTTNYPFVFVGDQAFPLLEQLMKPYPDCDFNILIPEHFEKLLFNYRLCRARRWVENAFGILKARMRIFRTEICAEKETVDLIIKAAVVIHNFLMCRAGPKYCPPQFADSDIDSTDGEWRKEADVNTRGVSVFADAHVGQTEPMMRVQVSEMNPGNRSKEIAIQVRETYRDYFVGPGAVPWQVKRVQRGLVLQQEAFELAESRD